MNAAEGHTAIIHLEGSLRTKGVCFHFRIYTSILLTYLLMISNRNQKLTICGERYKENTADVSIMFLISQANLV